VWESGGAGLLSTAADYARFAQMLLDGGWGLLSPASVATMLADHLPPGVAYGTSTRALGINAPVPANRQGYGLGVGVGARGDFFWGGALGPYFWADREHEIVAVLMLHENDPQRRARCRTLLRDAVYGALQ
jgi:CubicO group peptidase (beta-lactamase class C family)